MILLSNAYLQKWHMPQTERLKKDWRAELVLWELQGWRKQQYYLSSPDAHAALKCSLGSEMWEEATRRTKAALEDAGLLTVHHLTAASCSAGRTLVCSRLMTAMPTWPRITFPSRIRLQEPGLLSTSLTLLVFYLSALQLAVPFACKACSQIFAPEAPFLIRVPTSVSLPSRGTPHHPTTLALPSRHLLCIVVFISVTFTTTRNCIVYYILVYFLLPSANVN